MLAIEIQWSKLVICFISIVRGMLLPFLFFCQQHQLQCQSHPWVLPPGEGSHDRITLLCSVPLPNAAILRLILIYKPLGGTCSNQIQTIATPKSNKTKQAKPKIRTGMSQYSLPQRFQEAEYSNYYQTFKHSGSFSYNVHV